MTHSARFGQTLRDKYDALWNDGRSALINGTQASDHVPLNGEPRWGLSLVALPDPKLRNTLEDHLSLLPASHHFVPDSAGLHLTVSTLEPFQESISDDQIDFYADVLSQHTGLFGFQVSVRGLGGSRSGIHAQGFGDARLKELRDELYLATIQRWGLRDPAHAFVRDTAHISLTVFAEPTRPEPALAEHVNRYRNAFLGRLNAPTLALVDYVPVEQPMQLRIRRLLTK